MDHPFKYLGDGSLRLSSHESGGGEPRPGGPMNTPFGLCPICTEELAPEGELLQCPAGDYRAPAKTFSDRWDRYFKEEEKGFPGTNRLAAAETLLRDLQEMNVKEPT